MQVTTILRLIISGATKIQSNYLKTCHFSYLSFIGSECTNTDNGATDSYGDSCEWYDFDEWKAWVDPEDCGLYDDEDFTANEMCCECGGI